MLKIKSQINTKANIVLASGEVYTTGMFKASKMKPVYHGEIKVGVIHKLVVTTTNIVTAVWTPYRGGYDNSFLKVVVVDGIVDKYEI